MRDVKSRIDVYGFTHALSGVGRWQRKRSHKGKTHDGSPARPRPRQCEPSQPPASRSSSHSQKVMPYLARLLPISAANREPEPDMDRIGA